MKVEDGGASFSLVICEHSLTPEALDRLKSLEGVDKVLVDNNAFTVIFRVDSFLDITPSTVITAQQAIKKTFRDISRDACRDDSVPTERMNV
ncbi:MAG: hypothetical protein FIA94_07640 [Nitrospirae bacterium]|nr:hypothetical protein [Nitrospirota bacterium]